MADALALPFLQRALIGGALMGLLGGYFGTFVVQRRLVFLGDGLAHSAFGGIALGLLLGTSPLAIGVPFTVLVAAGITWLQQRTRLGPDTAVGIFFAVSMALGIIFLSLKVGFAPDAFSFLFGSILAVRTSDLWITGGVVLIAAATAKLWRRWAYATFDRELAQADRVPVQRDDYLLSIFVAVAVVAGIKLVGIVLVTAFLVIPAATARLLARSLVSMTAGAMAIGVGSALLGLVASYQLDLPSGATIILSQAAIFFAAFGLVTLRERRDVPTEVTDGGVADPSDTSDAS